jgi:hypothetical protein
MNDISSAKIPFLIEKLSSISWQWTSSAWNLIASSLEIHEKERKGHRIAYAYNLYNELILDAYFDGSNYNFLERIEIPLSFSTGVDDLSEEDYNLVLENFFDLYGESVGTISSVLSAPFFSLDNQESVLNGADSQILDFFEEFDALRLTAWNINNAILVLALFHQDRELPIVLSLCVVPPLENFRTTRDKHRQS